MSTSIASPNNSVRDTLPPYNASTPTAHKFTGVAETTDGYNSLSILLTAEFSVIIRVYQSQSNVGVWNDIEIFNYPSNNEAAGIAIYKTVLVKTAWFKVEVENISGNDNLVYLHTMKINSATGTNNYISVSSLEINGEVSGLYNGLLGVTGSSTITVPADTYIGITGMVGVSGYYNGLVGVTGSSQITVPANTFIGITGMVGVSGYYNGLVGVTGSSQITVPANTFIGITGVVNVVGTDGISANKIYTDVCGVQRTEIIESYKATPFKLLFERDLVNRVGYGTGIYWKLNTFGWELYGGVTVYVTFFKKVNSARAAPKFTNLDIWTVVLFDSVAESDTLPYFSIKGSVDNSRNYYKPNTTTQLYANVPYLFYTGNKPPKLHPTYNSIKLILEPQTVGNFDVDDVSEISMSFPRPGSGNVIINSSGFWDNSTQLEYSVSYSSNIPQLNNNYTWASLTGNNYVGITGSSAITIPADTFIGITGMVGVSGYYNGLVGVTGSSVITVPANTFIGITGIVGVSGYYNGLVGVTGSSSITVPANTFIGITGMVGVSGYYNGLVGVTGSSVITVPVNTFIGITGLVGISGFYNGLIGVTGSSQLIVSANTFIGITGLVGISGFYNGLVGVTGSSAITVPANTFIGITGLVGISGFYNGLIGVTGSSVITVPANTFIGITGMVGVSGYYNGLVGVTGSSQITVPANTFIGITGLVGISGYYNGLVGVTGSSVITVPANTFIGITGMVGVSGMYNGLVGITGSATIFGRDYIGGNTNTIYLDSKGVQITQLAKTDTNTVEYNLYTDLKNIIQLSPSYFSLDKDMINDGWYYDSTPEYNVGVVSFYDNLKFYNQPNFSLNDTTVWAIISCKNIDIAKTIAPPSIVVSTLPDASATYWRYRVPPDVKLYSGVSYLFYYGSKAIELNPSYTPILLTRTEGTAILTNNINATIFRISIYLGEYVPPPQGQAPVIRDSRNTTYLVKSAGLWDSNLNTSFVAEFGPKMSNIQVVGGTDGTLKYPIYTDVCGVQRTNIIETYKQSYKFN